MANKLNCTKGESEYFRITKTVGHKIDGKPIRKDFYGTGLRDAQSKAKEYLDNKEKGLNLDLGTQTLHYAMHTWLFVVKKKNAKNKETSFARYETSFRNMLLQTEDIANMKVKDITTLHFQKYLNFKVVDENKTYDQIKNFLKVLKMFFKYATLEGYTLKNPTINLNNPAKKTTVNYEEDDDYDYDDKNYSIYTEEEINKLKLEMYTYDYQLKFLILLAIETGMRKGELLGLKYKDIKNGTIRIRRTLTYPTLVKDNGDLCTQLLISEPKSKTSTRDLIFPENLITEFEIHKEKEIAKHNLLGLQQSKFIFTSQLGNNLNPKNFYTSFLRLLKRAEIEKGERTFHSIRDTYATRHALIGTPLPILQKLMGHKDITTTMQYVHVSVDETEKHIDNYISHYS